MATLATFDAESAGSALGSKARNAARITVQSEFECNELFGLDHGGLVGKMKLKKEGSSIRNRLLAQQPAKLNNTRRLLPRITG